MLEFFLRLIVLNYPSLRHFKITISHLLGDLASMALVGDPRRDLCSFRVVFSSQKLRVMIFLCGYSSWERLWGQASLLKSELQRILMIGPIQLLGVMNCT